MRHLLWALVERLAPTSASALTSFVFAWLTSPRVVGYYAMIAVVYTGILALTDGPMRQVAISAVGSRRGLDMIRRYQRVGVVFTCSVLFAVVLIMWRTGTPGSQALQLLPMVLAPLPLLADTRGVAVMQRAGEWRRLAGIQSMGVLVSCAIAIPLVWLTRGPLGPTVQTLVAETFFTWMVLRRAKTAPVPTIGAVPDQRYSTQYAQSASYSILEWGESRSDRLLVGVVAGSATLGLYNFGWTLSRNITDALGYGVANVLRPKILSGGETDSYVRGEIRATMRRGVLLTLGIAAITAVGAYAVLPHILSSKWNPELRLVPLMSLTALPALMSWCVEPVLLRMGRLPIGTAAKCIGVLMSGAIAAGVLVSLELAVWMALARGIITLAIMQWAARHLVPARTLAIPALCLAIGVVIYLVIRPWAP